MDKWIPPNVGPPDEEGFRTFSLYAPDGAEIIRVSFNLDRQREGLANTANEEEFYNRAERNRLKLASRIVAARDAFPGHNEDEALAILLLRLSPDMIAETLKDYFPSFALLGIRAASDVCVKRALNKAVQRAGAPRMYDDQILRKMLRHFESAATEFLEISRGRPLETEKHLKKTKQALEKLE